MLTCRQIGAAYLLVASLGSLGACGSRSSSSTSGEPPRLFDLEGRVVDPLRDAAGRTQVFFFAATQCPISNRYAPVVRKLYETFSSRGVDFSLVYPDPKDSPGAIRRHLREYDYPLRALRDPDHQLVRLTGVLVTPEAAVFTPGGDLIYRGRIDDRYADFGRARPAPTRHDVKEVLEALLSARPPPPRTTTAIGCYISDLQ